MGIEATNGAAARRPSMPARSAAVHRAPLIAGLLAVALIGLLALALVRVQADSRQEVEKRFTERARVTAAVTESLFSSSVSSAAAQNTREFGGPEVSVAALDRQAKSGNSLFAVVLDADGAVLAASRGTSPEVLAALERRPGYVRSALAGAFGLSDVLDRSGVQVMDFATGFKDRTGQPRALVTGIPAAFLGAFIGGYLQRLPDTERADGYVIDAHGAVVASTRKDAALGRPLPDRELAAELEDSAGGRYGDRFATATAVKTTPWRVVLSAKADRLYASVGGTRRMVPWLILALLGTAAFVSVALLTRVVRSTAALADANDRLGVTNERLASSHKRLEERATELARSNAELEQFASVASHDLQEPLRKVQAFGEQLEVKYAEQLPPEGVDYIHRMRGAAERMQRLIEDLLRFSRVMTRAEPFEWVDLTAVARDVVGDLETRIAAAGGRVDVGELGRLQADPLQMRQLLQNLIANGLKFRREGVAPEVSVTAEHHAGQAVLRVADNGIGFEDRHRERIFRVFERLHGRSEFEGTGIGLALCRRIVERHGGTISAQGTPGAGATFTVVVPVEHADPEAPAVHADGDLETVVPEAAHVA